MSTQFGDYRIEAMEDFESGDQVPWLAVRHLPCDSFVFDSNEDGWDTLMADQMMQFIQNHVCPPKED